MIGTVSDSLLEQVLERMSARARHVVIANDSDQALPPSPKDVRTVYSGPSTLLAYMAAVRRLGEFADKRYGGNVPDDKHVDMTSQKVGKTFLTQARVDDELVVVATGIGKKEWLLCEKVVDVLGSEDLENLSREAALEKIRATFPDPADAETALDFLTDAVDESKTETTSKYRVIAPGGTLYAGNDKSEAVGAFMDRVLSAAIEKGEMVGSINFRELDGIPIASITGADGKPIAGEREADLILVGVTADEFQADVRYASLRPTVH